MSILERLKLHLENTPKEQILKELRHAKRYDNPEGGGLLFEEPVKKWNLDHEHAKILIDEKIEFDDMESFSELLFNKPLKNSEASLYI